MEHALQAFAGTVDFKVNTVTGEAFISQRKAAELLGVTQPAIAQRCLSQNYEVSQGLSSDFLSLLITYYALDSRNTTPEAKALLKKTSAAGTKAFIYHQAGVQINAAPQPQFNLPTTYLDALKCLVAETEAHQETKAVKQQAVGHLKIAVDLLERDAPKVKAFDELMVNGENVLISDAAKVLGISTRDLFQWMASHGWIYRRGNNKAYKAYAERIDAGLLTHRFTKTEDGFGITHNNCQVTVTPQGISVLANLLVN